MPHQEVLLLAVHEALGGVCIAGMSTETDPVTGLRWVRPVREHGHVLLGDITTPAGEILRPFDVVEFNLLQPRAISPHTEDWTADFVRHRPCIVRRLDGERRASFLRKYLDTAPREALDSQQRSLCLIKPDWIKGCFRLDGHSGDFDARIALGLDRRPYLGSYTKGGFSVTDLKWRALGRAWLPPGGGWTEFDAGDLEARLGIREVYLAVGLTRSFQGTCWTLVIGVHTLPDYEATVDYANL
jgi:hypothetical protein